LGEVRWGFFAFLKCDFVTFRSIVDEILPLSRDVLEKATELRAMYHFKTPDAIHLATAIINQCDVFLTNDKKLRRCQEIVVKVIE
jgi:predicted nucleic acid-binding protein